MRTITIGNYTIQYPDDLVFLGDNNVISITTTNNTLSCKVTITNPIGQTGNLSYNSNLNKLRFNLDDNIKYLFDYEQIGDWIIDIEIDNSTTFSFSTKILAGKSFSNKTHGSSDVIYLYNGIDSIEIFSPHDGKLEVGSSSVDIYAGKNTIDLDDLSITQPGEYTLTVGNKTIYPPQAFILNVLPVSPYSSTIVFETIEQANVEIEGGSLWERKLIFPTTYRLMWKESCENDTVVLKYRNTDGVIRYINGKLLEEVDNFTPTLNHSISNGIYKYAPKYVNNTNSKVLKIGLIDIEPGADLNDIIYSDDLWILGVNNEWVSCVLKTNTIKNIKNNGFDNYELEVTINNL